MATSPQATLRIRNWSSFQHYKDRNPPWIRLYRDLLNDREWFALSGEQARLLVNLWLLAAEDEAHEGVLPALPDIAFRLRISASDLSAMLPALGHWLDGGASSVLAGRYQVDTPETETETETEGDTEGDTEAEGESEREISKSRVPRSTPAKQQKRAHQWPHEGFPGDYLTRAVDKGYSEPQAQEMAAAFLDHHLARGSTFKDWARAWGTWMRNEKKFNGKAKPGDGVVADIDDIPF